MTFSHLDADQRPTMVDVSGKAASERSATAEARVHFPAAVAAALRDNGLRSPKGPVFDTAIVAGVLGAKRTHELIPFCHPLGLESCRIVIDLEGDAAVIRFAGFSCGWLGPVGRLLTRSLSFHRASITVLCSGVCLRVWDVLNVSVPVGCLRRN